MVASGWGHCVCCVVETPAVVQLHLLDSWNVCMKDAPNSHKLAAVGYCITFNPTWVASHRAAYIVADGVAATAKLSG